MDTIELLRQAVTGDLKWVIIAIVAVITVWFAAESYYLRPVKTDQHRKPQRPVRRP